MPAEGCAEYGQSAKEGPNFQTRRRWSGKLLGFFVVVVVDVVVCFFYIFGGFFCGIFLFFGFFKSFTFFPPEI